MPTLSTSTCSNSSRVDIPPTLFCQNPASVLLRWLREFLHQAVRWHICLPSHSARLRIILNSSDQTCARVSTDGLIECSIQFVRSSPGVAECADGTCLFYLQAAQIMKQRYWQMPRWEGFRGARTPSGVPPCCQSTSQLLLFPGSGPFQRITVARTMGHSIGLRTCNRSVDSLAVVYFSSLVLCFKGECVLSDDVLMKVNGESRS